MHWAHRGIWSEVLRIYRPRRHTSACPEEEWRGSDKGLKHSLELEAELATRQLKQRILRTNNLMFYMKRRIQDYRPNIPILFPYVESVIK